MAGSSGGYYSLDYSLSHPTGKFRPLYVVYLVFAIANEQIARFMNMAAPMLEIPAIPFFLSTFFGSLPYNFVSCQAGEVIGQINSTADIFTLSMIVKMAVVSIISLIPVVFGSRIKKYMNDRVARKQSNINLQQYDPIPVLPV